MQDAVRLSKTDPAATLQLLPDTNHVLKTVTSDSRQENAETYAEPDLPRAPHVAEVIARFVRTASSL